MFNLNWFIMTIFRQSISHNPFYDMLSARKKKAQKSSVHGRS